MIRLAILSGTVALALIVAWQLGYFELSRREHLIAIIRRAEGTAWAAPLYVTSYTLVVALCLPATPFSILGGALFGTAGGLMLARTGATIGTIAAHTLARSIGKGALPPRQAQVASQTPRSELCLGPRRTHMLATDSEWVSKHQASPVEPRWSSPASSQSR